MGIISTHLFGFFPLFALGRQNGQREGEGKENAGKDWRGQFQPPGLMSRIGTSLLILQNNGQHSGTIYFIFTLRWVDEVISLQWVTSHCFGSIPLSLNGQYDAFPLFSCCYFILPEFISLEFASAKGEELGKDQSIINVCICSLCPVKIPGKRGRTGKNQNRMNVCSCRLYSVKIPWKRTGPPQKFWEKRGILLAIPPNGTTEEEQERTFGGIGEILKDYIKKTKLGLLIRDIITQVDPLLLMPTRSNLQQFYLRRDREMNLSFISSWWIQYK